jgi:hypothetical protein
MTCVLIDRPSFAWQRDPSTAQVVAARSPAIPPPIAFRHTLPRLFPVSPQAPRREHQAAPAGTAVLCFGFAALRVLVPPTARAPSKKARLGTWEQPSLTSVPAECPE